MTSVRRRMLLQRMGDRRGDVGEMRRAEDHPATHGAAVRGRMSAEVAEIEAADAAQKVEIDHDTGSLDQSNFGIWRL